eukprot:SAG31_NODE_5786_length_2330_cov_1.543702_2_plen_161_part_00
MEQLLAARQKLEATLAASNSAAAVREAQLTEDDIEQELHAIEIHASPSSDAAEACTEDRSLESSSTSESSEESDDQYTCDLCPHGSDNDIVGRRFMVRQPPDNVAQLSTLEAKVAKKNKERLLQLCKKKQTESIEDVCQKCFQGYATFSPCSSPRAELLN